MARAMNAYPYTPGHTDSDTSREAASKIAPHTQYLVRKIAQLLTNGPRACFEVEQLLDMSHQTASARMTEMREAGLIVDTGERRKTPTGRNAIVWKLAQGAFSVAAQAHAADQASDAATLANKGLAPPHAYGAETAYTTRPPSDLWATSWEARAAQIVESIGALPNAASIDGYLAMCADLAAMPAIERAKVEDSTARRLAALAKQGALRP